MKKTKKTQPDKLRKKAEPFIWSYQTLQATFYACVSSILAAIVSILFRHSVEYFFHYLVYAVAISGQAGAYLAQRNFLKPKEKIRVLYLASVFLAMLLESFFIWKNLLIPYLYQFLVTFGLAANGLAFTGFITQRKNLEKSGLMLTASRIRVFLPFVPFAWFAIFLLTLLLSQSSGVDFRNFVHFTIAPFLGAAASINASFVSGLVRSSFEFEFRR